MALAVCAPLLLRRGFALTHDMVFVPNQPFKAAWLGLDGSVPRAVPIDAIVSVVDNVMPGDLLQKAVLVGLLVVAGGGAAVLVRDGGVVARLAAATLYVWNPFVGERLAMGHWALLCGYAALPWVAVASIGVRERGWRSGPGLVAALSLAALTSPTGGVLAAVVCCVLLVGRDLRRSLGALGLSVGLNLPWIVPSLLHPGGIPSDPSGVVAFSAHPDTPYGVVGSLLSLGGIWNADAVPAGRDYSLLSGLMVAVSVASLVGLRWVRLVAPSLSVPRLIALGATGFGLAVLPALPAAVPALQWVDANVPGGGLLRDSQKWIALLALVEVVGVAALAEQLRRRWQAFGAQSTWWLVATLVVLPLAALPSLAWGVDGRLEPLRYPADWQRVADILHRDEQRAGLGAVAVLPWSTYRQFPWNDERPVLDPAPRYFPGTVVGADTLRVGDITIAGESSLAARIGRQVTGGGDVGPALRRLGVGLVVVERHTPGPAVTFSGVAAYRGRDLELWVLGRAAPGPAGPSSAAQAAIVTGDVAAGCLLTAALAVAVRARLRRYSRRR